ncbi:MAG: PEP-CTERM sorting domain-containing protein [Singulisphaera sp.]|nr:PEP-CTERM sorting domain-containing protein [Singulisphaera sp.]
MSTHRQQILRAALGLAVGLIATGPAIAGPAIGDVFYIDLENHNFTQPSTQTGPQQLLGNPAAPYLNSLITPGNPNAAQTSYASDYYNVLATPSGNNPHIHPSEPNYVWQEAGLAGPLNDNDPYPNNIVNAPNLSGLLQKAGIPWKSYQEDIDLAKNSQGRLTSTVLPRNQWTVPLTSFSGTSPAYTNPYNGSHQYNFAPKHDGQLFFTATNGGNNPTPSNPEAKFYAPLQQLSTDLANNTVGRYNLITPDQYNEMHSSLNTNFTYHGVTYQANTDQEAVALGDNFLSKIIPQIMASQAYKKNGAIVIWNDESEGGDDYKHALTEIVISPLAKGNAYDSTTVYSHSSDLKTMEEIFGVYGPKGYLGDAGSAGVNDLSNLFLPGAVPVPVPEPASAIMMALGLGGVVVIGRRLARKSA